MEWQAVEDISVAYLFSSYTCPASQQTSITIQKLKDLIFKDFKMVKTKQRASLVWGPGHMPMKPIQPLIPAEVEHAVVLRTLIM